MALKIASRSLVKSALFDSADQMTRTAFGRSQLFLDHVGTGPVRGKVIVPPDAIAQRPRRLTDRAGPLGPRAGNEDI
jgi:hypothetical protein